MNNKDSFDREKPRKMNRGLKITLIVLLVLAVAVGAVVIAGVTYYNRMLGQITYVEAEDNELDFSALETLPTADPEESVPEETMPKFDRPMNADDIVNIMLIGNSSREDASALLADTCILVSINKYTNTVTLTSVLRDAFVRFPSFTDDKGKLHGGGNCKFTVCYNLGYLIGGNDIAWGMKVVNLTMQQNFGVEVDYDFEVNFEGFMDLVNRIGGVGLELTAGEAEYMNKALEGYTVVKEGTNHLDGYMALTYARCRHAKDDPTGDIGRTRRQRYLMEQIFGRVKKEDPATILAIVNDMMPYLTTNMPASEINSLVLDVLPMLGSLKIKTGTCPARYRGEMVVIYEGQNEESVLKFDKYENTRIMQAITEGVTEETSK